MSSERLDLIIFGATGFTGKWAVAEVHRQSKQRSRLTWGIAGRSEEKLKAVLKELEEKIGENVSVPIIIADIADEESIKNMAARAKVIVNCCGPYRFYGEPVVKACVEAGTHQVDISGEPQYMEKMQLEYNKTAQEKGIYIISACGFDSIPCDLGVVYVENKFDGTVNSIESYLESSVEGEASGALVNYGTWESAVYGLAHMNELKSLRKQLYPERLPQFKPKLEKKSVVHKSDVAPNKWCLPFLGSDRSVVMRSQRYMYEHEKKRPIQIETYFTIGSFWSVILLGIFGTIFGILARFNFGRKLLLAYPSFFSAGLFSKEGPKEEVLERVKFSITFSAEGWSKDKKLAEGSDQHTDAPNKKMIARIEGKNPGYGFTTLTLVATALTILDEKDKMPENGGVLPPGAAFAKTSLIEKLIKNDVVFEVLNVQEVKDE